MAATVRKLQFILLILMILAGSALYIVDDPLSIVIDTPSCDWETVETEDGQTFSSINELKEASGFTGEEWDVFTEVNEFRVVDSTVEIRAVEMMCDEEGGVTV